MATAALKRMQPETLAPVAQALPEKYARFDAFLKTLWGDVYPEIPSTTHSHITELAWNRVKETQNLPAGAKILDVGCGQGVALKHFAADGHDAIGIALGEDVGICQAAGYNVVEMDLSFLEFEDETFDLVWCRHVLEHSVFPLFSLTETCRVLKPGGVLYMEVPAPDTPCRHQTNPNHYSVLGKSMWTELIGRAGYSEMVTANIDFKVALGDDQYWSFIARKKA